MMATPPVSPGGGPPEASEPSAPVEQLSFADLQRAIAQATSRFEADLRHLDTGAAVIRDGGMPPSGVGDAPTALAAASDGHVAAAATEPAGLYPAASTRGASPHAPRGRRVFWWFGALAIAILIAVLVVTAAVARRSSARSGPPPSAAAPAVPPPVQIDTAPVATSVAPTALAVAPPTEAPPVAATSTPVPTIAPTARPVSAATPAPPTATPPSGATLAAQVATAEDGLRSGTFDVAIDYGAGSRSIVSVRFDLGDPARPRRMAFSSTSDGPTGRQSVELVAVGERTWQRLPDGGWGPAVSQDGLWEQLEEYLPRILAATNPTVARDGEVLLLRWNAADRNADLELRVDAATGRPLELRVTGRGSQTALIVSYTGWNTPVAITEPGP